eukprot:816804-Pleurochrysis_carterae.AAC.5
MGRNAGGGAVKFGASRERPRQNSNNYEIMRNDDVLIFSCIAAPPAWRCVAYSPWGRQPECGTATQDLWRHALRNSRPS